MKVALVVAMTPEQVIGRDGALPWRLPADLRHFKRLTLGHAVIMGRRTFESIGKPLVGRTNIVLTRRAGFVAPGCIVVGSVEAALAAARNASSTEALAEPAAAESGFDPIVSPPDEILVIGGGEVYALFLPRAQRLYVTWVQESIDGNTRFPAFDASLWRETHHLEHPADERNPVPLRFSVFERRGALPVES
ncbi:MAG TPA: dihydrofolate reductase [Candidatus Krumholzibacteria bacterium]|nr:dihydrofolate reductase [Candidatus Krumholzibacteria bacterium]